MNTLLDALVRFLIFLHQWDFHVKGKTLIVLCNKGQEKEFRAFFVLLDNRLHALLWEGNKESASTLSVPVPDDFDLAVYNKK